MLPLSRLLPVVAWMLMLCSASQARPSTFLPEDQPPYPTLLKRTIFPEPENWEQASKRYFLPQQRDFYSSLHKRQFLPRPRQYISDIHKKEVLPESDYFRDQDKTAFLPESYTLGTEKRNRLFLPQELGYNNDFLPQSRNYFQSFQKKSVFPEQGNGNILQKKDLMFLPQQVKDILQKRDFMFLPQQVKDIVQKRDFMFLPQQVKDIVQKRDFMFLPQQVQNYNTQHKKQSVFSNPYYWWQKRQFVPRLHNQDLQKRTYLMDDGIYQSFHEDFLPEAFNYYHHIMDKKSSLSNYRPASQHNFLPETDKYQSLQKKDFLPNSADYYSGLHKRQIFPDPSEYYQHLHKKSIFPESPSVQYATEKRSPSGYYCDLGIDGLGEACCVANSGAQCTCMGEAWSPLHFC